MLWKSSKVKGTVGLRQRHLHVPLQLHRRVCHNGSWTAKELIGVPEIDTTITGSVIIILMGSSLFDILTLFLT